MEKLRKLIASVSFAALLASCGFSAVAQAATFSDVSEDHWAYEAVEQLVTDGVVDVADTFRCNDSTPRSEFAGMVADSFGFDSSTDYDAEFSDVVAGAWYVGYINVLAQNGVMTGDTDADGNPLGTVRPGAYVNRAEAAKMIVLAAGLELVTPAGDVFSDVADVDAWYAPYVETLYQNSVVVGYGDGTFLPAKEVTRCEVSVMIFKAKNPVAVVEPVEPVEPVDDTTDTDGDGVLDTVDVCPTVAASAAEDVDLDGCVDEAVVIEASEGTLTVALGDEITGSSVPQQATHVEMMNIDLTSSDEDVTVTDIIVARKGVGSAADFSNLYLYQGADRLTTGRTISTSTNTVTFSSLDVDVEAGETVTLTLVVDYADGHAANSDYFQVESADAVTHNGASTEGDFPLSSEEFSIAGQDVGTITVERYGTLSNITVGEQDAEIAKFTLNAVTEDTWLNQVSLRVRGGISNTLISNFVLSNGGTEVATTESLNSSDLMVFVLDTPIEVTSGDTEIFTVTADIGAADANDTVLVDLDENADLIAIGEVYGFGSGVTSTDYDGNTTGAAATSCTDVTWEDASCTTVEGGQVTISFNGPTASDVGVNEKDVSMFEFSMTAQADVEVRKLTFTLTASTAEVGGDTGLIEDAATANFTDIKVVDTDTGIIVGSTQDVSITGSDTAQTFNYTDTFTIDAGEVRNFAVKLDVANNSALGTNGTTVLVTMSAVSTSEGIRDIDTGDYVTDIVPSSALTGNTMTIKSPSLAVSLSSSPSDQTVVKGSDDVNAVGFALTAGSASNIKVSSITLTGYLDEDGTGSTYTYSVLNGTLSIDEAVESIVLYDGNGTLVSSTAGVFNSSSTVTFSGMDWTIPAGTTAKLIPVIDVSSSAYISETVDTIALDLADVSTDISCEDADGHTVTATGDAANGGTTPNTVVTIQNVGTITVAAADSPVLDDAAIAGDDSSTDPLLVGRFKIYANNEPFTVTEMKFKNDSAAINDYEDSDAIDLVILKYPESATDPDTLSGEAEVTLLSGVASFTGLNIAVPKSDNTDENAINVELYVVTNSIASAGAFSSGVQVEMDFDFDASTPGFKAVGTGSQETITDSDTASLGMSADIDANEIALYQALPTFAYHSSTSQCPGSLTGTDADPVYCFSVTATGGAIALYSLEFAASANLLSTGTGTGALGVTNGWTITEYGSSGLIGSSLGSGTWASNVVTLTFASEEVVAEDTPAYYVVKAPIIYTASDDTSSLSVYLQQDTAYIANTGASSVTSGTNIVWSDRSASSHTTSTADWTGGYKLETLPTTTLRSAE